MSFKCLAEAKTHIPEDMRLELMGVAHMLGCTLGEVLRDIIYINRRGETFGEHVANHRRSILEGKGPSQGITKPADLPPIYRP